MREKLFIIFIVFLCLFSPPVEFGNQSVLDINPNLIDIGDIVTIKISKGENLSSYKISILSPSGKIYSLIPEKKADYYQSSFCDTYDKGFLKTDWNKYVVNLFNSKGELIESSNFFLREKNKKLYFSVYVDDIGGEGYLNSDSERWFKGLGGKLNYGYQNDDLGRKNVSIRKVISKYKDDEDFIFHHFHSYKFLKGSIFLRLNRLLKWKEKKEFVNRYLDVNLRDRHFILLIIIILTLMAWYLYKKNKTVKFILIANILFGLYIFLAILASQFVLSENNWKFTFYDLEWSKKLLRDTKIEFEENNLLYPQIIRHGFNIPPRGLNRFYLTQMGVMADASFEFPNSIKLKNDYKKDPFENRHNYNNYRRAGHLGNYSYNWPNEILLPLPYYTNISGELNIPYDGNEHNRGLLEMPLTFGNICANGLYEVDYEIIDKLPEGALVSTYVHPSDDLHYLNDVVSYIKRNYDVSFVSAKEYLEIYLRYFPRPVLIDAKPMKSYWAYLQGDRLISISECDLVFFNNKTIYFNFINLPPYIGAAGNIENFDVLEKKYDFIATNDENIRLYRRK